MPDMNRLNAIEIIKHERDMVQKEIDVGQGTRKEDELVAAYNQAIEALEYVEKDMEAKRIRFRMPAKHTLKPIHEVNIAPLKWTNMPLNNLPVVEWKDKSADQIIREISKVKKMFESKNPEPTFAVCPICGNRVCQQFSWNPPTWYCFNCHELMTGDNVPTVVLPR